MLVLIVSLWLEYKTVLRSGGSHAQLSSGHGFTSHWVANIRISHLKVPCVEQILIIFLENVYLSAQLGLTQVWCAQNC